MYNAKFYDNHKKIEFTSDKFFIYPTFEKNRWIVPVSNWEILSLNKGNFKIKSDDINNKIYEITFYKKK